MQNSFLMASRHRKKLSQEELARLAGINKSYICQLESGERKPYPKTIEAIASILEIDAEELQVSFGIMPQRYISILQNYPKEMSELMGHLCKSQKDNRGKFITFEGIEGSGKSTQAYLLYNWLQEKGIPAILTREPGGTKMGCQLRSYLLNGDEAIAPQTELLLLAADRSHHIETVIKPSLSEGKIVLCDRFTDSTIAYQGYGRRIDVDIINQLNDTATRGIKSDLTFWLDIDVKSGLSRAKKRLGNLDRIEQEDIAFHHRISQGFKTLANRNPRIHRINAELPVADIRDEIQRVISGIVGIKAK